MNMLTLNMRECDEFGYYKNDGKPYIRFYFKDGDGPWKHVDVYVPKDMIVSPKMSSFE